ncbi:MAG: SpoIIE family protein phosphatase [Actinobacteria bacterium]|nr:SpoIIE family protein phosphatase [Actinomycetota bacterium]
MASVAQRALNRFRRRKAGGAEAATGSGIQVAPVEIAPNDPLVAYFQTTSGAVDVDNLDFDSPAAEQLKRSGVKLVVPLVSQGELIGLLNLGPRRSEREYSGDDRKLLDTLAAHAAPALRVAQLVKQQEAEVRTRERLEQELRVAQLIQQQFLPKELPDLPGWQVAAFYQPARQVGGDFYDFIDLPDGKVGIVVGDVTDKGVPAALVMATTHSILRGEAPRLNSPGQLLERANNRLFPDIPSHMFVTCLYGVLDPQTGRFVYANAGHNLPYVRSGNETLEYRATGMPLGLMAGMKYEEKEAIIEPGQAILFHSDGLAEAHNPQREMFGFGRLKEEMAGRPGGNALIDHLLDRLRHHTGHGWEQEDDITLVTLERAGGEGLFTSAPASIPGPRNLPVDGENELASFSVGSSPGNEREAMRRVEEAVADLTMPPAQLERLKTAVSEATMNAIEHGNKNQAEVPVDIRVTSNGDAVTVYITDQGGDQPTFETPTPDIEAKLAGTQTPRGWGLFLIKNMVDEMDVITDEHHHTLKLVLRREGEDHDA